MPLPVIADVARVVFKYNSTSLPTNPINVMHVQKGLTADTWNDIADNISAQLANSACADLFAPMSSNWGFGEFDLTPLDGTSNTIHRTIGTSLWAQPSASGDNIPNSAAIVKLTTDTRGRSFRGRLYLGPVGEGSTGNGNVNSTPRDACTASWVHFANLLEGSIHPAALVVASYKRRVATQVTNLACETRLGTQRRRQVR